ncbi:MAG: DUF2093 domain-containing protein [Pseudomonadota bacterium]
MNPFDGIGAADEAVLDYGDADFRIVKPGAFVVCAITGKRISLRSLRYWSVDKQEPYFDAIAAAKGFGLVRGE